MTNLTLELNINSASDLENVNHITKMNVYAITTLRGDKKLKKQKVKTAVDHSGGSNPTWNHAVKFSINEKLALEGRLTLAVRLFSKRLLGDKEIGGIEVPLLDLLRSHTPSTNGHGNSKETMNFVTYQVRTPSETMKGSLTLSYRFIGATVYQQAPTWATPSQQGYGPYGYMLPPPPIGYGYGVPPQQPTRNEARLQNGDTLFSAISLIS
ncbi:unnamed protein product [Arabidopsis lyrata]|nr:unnamed protein product [Arabidopsis lyrata]